jgi:hypothetical protein
MGKVTQADTKAIDIMLSGTESDETNFAIQEKLGLNDDDVQALRLSRESDPDTADAVRTKVYDKIRSTKDRRKDTQSRAGEKALVQGITFGFSDEIAAAFDTLKEKAQKGGDIGEIFEKKVKQERDELKRLEKKYPLNMISGEIIGGLLIPIPGGQATGAARAGKLLGEAALFSAGKAEGPLLSSQFLEETAKGTALGFGAGAVLGKAGQKAGELLKKGISPSKKLAKGVSSVLFDLPPAYTERLIDPKTAKKILNPKSPDEIVESIKDMTETMAAHARGLSGKASQKLSSKTDIPVDNVLAEIQKMPSVTKINRSTLSEAEKAKKEVAGAMDDLINRSDKKMVSEKDLKQYIQDIDLEIPWNKNDWTLKDQVLGDVRKLVDNQILKAGNRAYADAMVPVSELMKNIKDISKSFSFKRDGYKLVPSDTTYSKVRNFFNVAGISKKPVTEKALVQAEGRFAGPAKPTVLEDIELSQIAARTEGGQPAGSRNLLMGLLAGTPLGIPFWGAVVGAIKDKYGRKIGKEFIPKVSGAIEITDEAMKKAFETVSPALARRILEVTGRVAGSEKGVGSIEPTIIPERTQPTFSRR